MSHIGYHNTFSLKRKLLLLLAIPLAIMLISLEAPHFKEIEKKAIMQASMIHTGITNAKAIGIFFFSKTVKEHYKQP
ncbi:hypothetical protein [Roseivirga pacifica]|uniref:hypothetical protein n=1 Tax=Roseivirga pacifica TaxID=1267423 RepID=UPI00227BB0C6|nr:hypothetical protein [Roseivirga pacifica]